MNVDYLIIGNSAGGIGAAEAIREVDKSSSVMIVSEESYPAYSRPLISEYLAHERDVDGMLYRSADFYKHNMIDLVMGSKALMLDTARKLIKLDSGENIVWKKLLLATGGVPIVPQIQGSEKKGVFPFITLEHAKDIDAFMSMADVKHAVVIGGGLIGISVSQALRERNVEITIIEMKDRILNTILDEPASQIAANVVKQHGVTIIVNNTVAEITGNANVKGVVLQSGETLPCDMVIMAIGVLPRVDLAKTADIKINRGIVVDRFMMTNQPDIYACGDVAEAYDFVLEINRLTPLWPNAYVGGRVAGNNMAGNKTEYRGGTAMNSIHYFGLSIPTAGLVEAPAGQDGYELQISDKGSIYRKIIIYHDRIAGMIITGDIDKAGILFGLIRDAVDVSSFKSELLADDFGLAYLPAEVRKERLGALS